METIEKLKRKLIKKLNIEYKEYISELKELSIDEVIEKSYETAMKQQFLSLLGEENSIERNEVKALLESDNTLDDLYEQWDHDINDFGEVINDSFIYSLNEMVESYEESVQLDLENDENYELIQKIINVMSEVDRSGYCDKLKERYGISEIDTLIVDEILKDKQERKYLNDFLNDIKDNEHIQHLCENMAFNNRYYNDIEEKILSQIKEMDKELRNDRIKKSKEMER